MQPSPPLDPELAEVLAAFPAGVDPGVHLRDMNVVRMLRSTLDLLEATGGSLPTDERVTVENRSIPGPDAGAEIPVRIYAPVARRSRSAGGPGVLPRRCLRPR